VLQAKALLGVAPNLRKIPSDGDGVLQDARKMLKELGDAQSKIGSSYADAKSETLAPRLSPPSLRSEQSTAERA
jgi:hypothetical protein